MRSFFNTKMKMGTSILVLLLGGMGGYFFMVHPQLFTIGTSVWAYPFLRMQHYLLSCLHNKCDATLNHQKLLDRLERVTQERDSLREENILLHATFSYYEDIHEVVAFKNRYQQVNSIVTQVLNRTLTAAGHSMLVDVGSAHGVTGHMVAVSNNCIVGVVEQVYPLYSKVRLVTDKKCKIAVYGVASRMHGIYEGNNTLDGGVVNYVSHLTEPVTGELLISSGQGLIFPQGFGVATLVAYEHDNLYYRVHTKPLIEMPLLNYCVLMPPKQAV